MKDEQKTKKGFFGMLKESFSKTGGCCCGPGETCDGSGKKVEKAQSEAVPAKKEVSQPAQK